MKKLKPKGIKTLKSLHLLFVMMWVMGVVVMGIVYFTNPKSGDELHNALLTMRIVDDFLVIPGAMLTIITGIIYGQFTNWGFFKHRWIIVKWIVSILIIIIGTFVLNPWLELCLEITTNQRDIAINNANISNYFPLISISAAAQSLALIFLVIISVFKPWKGR